MVKGHFYKPETVLDMVGRAHPVENGVIEITGRDISGRLGIKNNKVVTGGVVDKTGETGTGAICRLLLLPYGMYSYRHAVPADHLYLQQDLNLPFDDAIRFLSGPSSIGLAYPGKQTLNNLKALTGEPELTGPDFSWQSTSVCSSYEGEESSEPEVDAGNNDSDSRSDSRSNGAGSNLANSGSDEYINDCKNLVESVDRKRKEILEIKIKEASQTQTRLEALNPGPLPKRKENRQSINKVHVAAGVGALVGLIGLCVIMESRLPDRLSEAVASAPPVEQVDSDPGYVLASDPVPATAPFVLPSSPPPAEPPASTFGAANDTAQASNTQPVPAISSQNTAPPTSNEIGDAEINRWLDAVRKDPGDAKARRELAQAYLLKGDTTTSIEQFYSVMKLRKVDATEIIAYANNLMVFGSKDLSRQFLTNILRSDPSQNTIRERLAEIR